MTEGNGNRSWLEIDSVHLSRVFVKWLPARNLNHWLQYSNLIGLSEALLYTLYHLFITLIVTVSYCELFSSKFKGTCFWILKLVIPCKETQFVSKCWITLNIKKKAKQTKKKTLLLTFSFAACRTELTCWLLDSKLCKRLL